MTLNKNLPWRSSVAMVLLNKDGQVFVGHKDKHPNDIWEMPQGAIDPGEAAREAVVREMQEETGLWHHHVSLFQQVNEPIFVDLPADMVGVKWNGQYRGERQTWYIYQVDQEDAINIHGPHPEYNDWRWVAPSDLPSICFPYRRAAYKRIRKILKDLSTLRDKTQSQTD